MPNYVRYALQRLKYKPKVFPQYSPHHYTSVKYTTQPGRQFSMQDDTTPLLLPKETKYIQSVVGSFLYYSRAIDGTMLPVLAQIAQQQSQLNTLTKEKCQQLIDYATTYNKAKIRFMLVIWYRK